MESVLLVMIALVFWPVTLAFGIPYLLFGWWGPVAVYTAVLLCCALRL